MAAVGSYSYVPERCHSAANFTPSDVVEFITTGQKPANCETVLCSTLLLLECGLRDQGMSVNEHLPGLVHAIDSAVELPTYCSNVLKKIWKKAEECGQEDLDNLLASPVSSVYKPKKKEDPNKVGEECAKAGITRHVLDKGWDNPPEIVSKETLSQLCEEIDKQYVQYYNRYFAQTQRAVKSKRNLKKKKRT
ncbi:PREDICTED: uncharacterized protein LOC109487903 [Branchiostoma belcheri]|uniref:Uncharacterized protein LOC109487903 n=1 Tax=Branchiostoma belcheri TaxID=7741 RepID=A0A6P5ACX7_BRABE|nr:PREDICTED: uncharacterized protein LOC109487903 [Branchiostoma belcheri]